MTRLVANLGPTPLFPASGMMLMQPIPSRDYLQCCIFTYAFGFTSLMRDLSELQSRSAWEGEDAARR